MYPHYMKCAAQSTAQLMVFEAIPVITTMAFVPDAPTASPVEKKLENTLLTVANDNVPPEFWTFSIIRCAHDVFAFAPTVQ